MNNLPGAMTPPPLHAAARAGDLARVDSLLNTGADINATDGNNDTAFIHACRAQQENVIYLLVLRGADAEIGNLDGESALSLSVGRRWFPAVRRRSVQSLFDAIEQGDGVNISRLLDLGVSATLLDEDGKCPLFAAAACLNHLPLQLIVKWGADLKVTDNANNNALDIAAAEGLDMNVRVLLDAGFCGFMGPFRAMRTSINYDQVESGNFGVADTVLDFIAGVEDKAVRSCYLDASGEDGRRMLHFVAEYGYVGICSRLIDLGANVHAVTVKNLTPLSVAAYRDHTAIVGLLIAAGASINHRGDDGRTSLRLALDAGSTAAATLLMGHGADDLPIMTTATSDASHRPGQLSHVLIGNGRVQRMVVYAPEVFPKPTVFPSNLRAGMGGLHAMPCGQPMYPTVLPYDF